MACMSWVNFQIKTIMWLYIILDFTKVKSKGAIIQFVSMKWCGVYGNQGIIKDYFGMCTVYQL